MPVAPTSITWIVIALALWLGLAVVGALAERTPPAPRPDLATGLIAMFIRLYCRVVHGLRVEGAEHLAAALKLNASGRGVVVTANHAAGIDPMLIQSSVPFFIRWLAAAETVAPAARGLVEFADVIFVSGIGGPAAGPGVGMRRAIRYLQGDPHHPLTQGRAGFVGLFPEGRIARRAGVITPFQPGIGLMIGRSGAVVLPVVIKGVPIRDNTYSSFLIPSRSTVEFMPPIDYAATGTKANAITGELQGRYQQWVGPVVPPQGRAGK